MEPQLTALRLLLQRRHWQPHRTFLAEYDKAAASLDRRLVGHGPSRVQLHRWQSGRLGGLPYPDHCRVLEAMFPGWTADELFAASTSGEVARRDRSPEERRSTADDNFHAAFSDVTAVYSTRGEFMSAVSPKVLFDGARSVRAVGLSLNLLCQHYPDQSLYKLVDSGASLCCLFLDPAGEAIKAREREEGHDPGSLSVLTEFNIQLMRRVRDKLPDDKRGDLTLATYDETVRNNIIFVNDDLCVAQPYLNHSRGVDSPTFVIERRAADRGLYQVYDEVFTSLWNGGRML
jgi:hypothetical protein